MKRSIAPALILISNFKSSSRQRNISYIKCIDRSLNRSAVDPRLTVYALCSPRLWGLDVRLGSQKEKCGNWRTERRAVHCVLTCTCRNSFATTRCGVGGSRLHFSLFILQRYRVRNSG